MKIGIIGVQGSGKTTVFQLLCNKPTSTLASIDIPDKRLDYLKEVLKSKKKTYSKIEFFDPPGFTKTNLSFFQKVDALIYVIPWFQRFGEPMESLQELQSQLIQRDKEICEGALKKEREPKEEEALRICDSSLSKNKPLSLLQLNEESKKLLKGFGFLTLKPAIVILNSDKNEVDKFTDLPLIKVNAKLELEISELKEEEKEEYKKEFGIKESLLEKFVKIGLPGLNIISFFTVVGNEVRAWQIKEGTPVIKAAGKVHSDMERGFIRAEVIGFEEFKDAGSFKVAKERGLLRSVKQEYIVKDGDIIEFKFQS